MCVDGLLQVPSKLQCSAHGWLTVHCCYVFCSLCCLQVRLLTVNDAVLPYTEEVAARMRKAGIRVEVNGQATINKLIRWGGRQCHACLWFG